MRVKEHLEETVKMLQGERKAQEGEIHQARFVRTDSY